MAEHEHGLVIGIHLNARTLGRRAGLDADRPARLNVVIDGSRHRKAVLLMVGGGPGESLLVAVDLELEIGQHEVAVLGPAGAAAGQRFVGQHA